MAKYVVGVDVVLHLLREGIQPLPEHKLLAPTLIRSQVLDSLYKQVRTGELPMAEGKQLLVRFSEIKIRYLGDKVLRRRAWELAEQLGWESTDNAEYIALTQLQADAFVTMDEKLVERLEGVVVVTSLGSLF